MTDLRHDEVTEIHRGAVTSAIEGLAGPGDWLTGEQRVDVWHETRSSVTDPLDRERRQALSPETVDGAHRARRSLPAAAVDVVHRVASDPGRLRRTWAEARMSDLSGPEVYTELVAVTAIASVVDRFCVALGLPVVPLPEPLDGDPARTRADGVGDVGAWVPQSVDKTRANVSRAVSLLVETDRQWRMLVDAFYSRGAEFFDLGWDRPLSRPQVELVAARTTALNECFY